MNVNNEIKRLARSTCAAFLPESNGCRFEPNGQSKCNFFRNDAQALPFIESGDMRCFEFERGVLPNDPSLESHYWNRKDKAEVTSHCATCGTAFSRNSNRQKHCPPCSVKNADKNRKAARIRYRQKPTSDRIL